MIYWQRLTSSERDALVAEHVMHLRIEHYPATERHQESAYIVGDNGEFVAFPPVYTRHAAWEVLQKIIDDSEDKVRFSFKRFTEKHYYCELKIGSRTIMTTADTPMEGVCVCALMLAGVDITLI